MKDVDYIIEGVQKYGSLSKLAERIGFDQTALRLALQHEKCSDKMLAALKSHYEDFGLEKMPLYSLKSRKAPKAMWSGTMVNQRLHLLVRTSYDFCGSIEEIYSKTGVSPYLLRFYMNNKFEEKKQKSGNFLAMCMLEKFLRDNSIPFPSREEHLKTLN